MCFVIREKKCGMVWGWRVLYLGRVELAGGLLAGSDVGSSATLGRELGQIRKEAAISESTVCAGDHPAELPASRPSLANRSPRIF